MLARTARVMSVPADCHSLPSVAWHIVATRAVRPERISVRKRKGLRSFTLRKAVCLGWRSVVHSCLTA